jgi:hypothetical protein
VVCLAGARVVVFLAGGDFAFAWDRGPGFFAVVRAGLTNNSSSSSSSSSNMITSSSACSSSSSSSSTACFLPLLPLDAGVFFDAAAVLRVAAVVFPRPRAAGFFGGRLVRSSSSSSPSPSLWISAPGSSAQWPSRSLSQVAGFGLSLDFFYNGVRIA